MQSGVNIRYAPECSCRSIDSLLDVCKPEFYQDQVIAIKRWVHWRKLEQKAQRWLYWTIHDSVGHILTITNKETI